MIRKQYAHQIDGLRTDLMHLGNTVEQALVRAMHTLETRNQSTALWVIQHDDQIDEAHRNLEDRVITLLATQQPIVAHDLRLVTAMLAIAAELERIGDYASAIAKRVYRASPPGDTFNLLPDLQRMTQLAVQMLHTSMEAFLHEDVEKARSLCDTDEEVDALEDTLNDSILTLLQADPQTIRAGVDMLDVVHALERTADRATNIGEQVIYLVTSGMEDLNP